MDIYEACEVKGVNGIHSFFYLLFRTGTDSTEPELLLDSSEAPDVELLHTTQKGSGIPHRS